MAITIIKGAQYSVAFTIRNNGVLVTSETVDGVRIALGNQIATYPDGSLTFSAEDSTWRFPMTQANTYALNGTSVEYQVQIKIGDEIFPSETQSVKLSDTMFRERWD